MGHVVRGAEADAARQRRRRDLRRLLTRREAAGEHVCQGEGGPVVGPPDGRTPPDPDGSSGDADFGHLFSGRSIDSHGQP